MVVLYCHDQTHRAGRHRVVIIPAILIAGMITTARARGPAGPEPDPRRPLILAADRVRHWDQGVSRWVLLEGNAAVETPEGRSIRSERALVRLRPLVESDHPAAVVAIFADGQTWTSDPGGRPSDSLRVTLTTDQNPLLRARTDAGVVGLAGPPADVDWIARAFPDESPAPPTELPVVPAPESSRVASEAVESKADLAVVPTQFEDDAFDAPELTPPMPAEPDSDELPAVDDQGESMVPLQPPTDLMPLPESEVPPPPVEEKPRANPPPMLPGTRRTWSITPRYGGRTWQLNTTTAADGSTVYIIRGGVIIVSEVEGRGRVDLAADHVVLWIKPKAGKDDRQPNPTGTTTFDPDQPIEAYLEGDVVIRQDELKLAGTDDQHIIEAENAYFDFRTERVVANKGEFKFYAPGFLAPIRAKGDLINQYRPVEVLPNGKFRLGPTRISADQTTTTGSRFPIPAYRFNSRAIDLQQIQEPMRDPFTGGVATPPGKPAPVETSWLIDARQNFYFIGPIPFFYWPRIVTTDDLDPPLRNFSYRYGTYFGHQTLFDLSGFKLLGMKKPGWIDTWNIDADYLSMRGPALGSEIGWFGRDLIGNLMDPYGTRKLKRGVDRPFFGYFDVWGIRDTGVDVLGSGPAVVTYGPPGAGKNGYQRNDVPSFQTYRGRFLFRHMQSLVDSFAPEDEDLRLQVEAAGYSDRHFLEQYYKRLWDTGLDQDTLAYLLRQNRNTAFTLQGQVNFMPWITDTQWLPKAEYYRFGDALFGNLFSYSQNSGVDYANVHTAVEVNNPNIFAFMPYDPVSNTSGPWSSGRAWTTHQLSMPLKLGFIRLTPYGVGQLMGWSSQLDNQALGRAWGGGGARANIMAWRTFDEVESEMLNVHGFAHKINFDVDYRNVFSNVPLNQIGIQDQYDDDTYEFTRRYFALTNYVGGLLPLQYDPRFLILRRAYNPIAFTPDIQASMQTLKFNLNQRLQTKRGPEGQRRIVDYMVFDLQTIYYPYARRDNFGKAFGQNMYNFEWFLGDRTSIVSTGWFEFWDIAGNPILVTNPRHENDPFGLNVITAGVSVNRPPRGSIYMGYSIINTGPIQTSALNASFNYWLSPKWYTSFSTSYDFGNAILLAATFSLTKIGPDFLTSVGLTVDPQRQNYTFGLEIAPRFSPNVRLGSAVGTRFDSRFAPTQ